MSLLKLNQIVLECVSVCAFGGITSPWPQIKNIYVLIIVLKVIKTTLSILYSMIWAKIDFEGLCGILVACQFICNLEAITTYHHQFKKMRLIFSIFQEIYRECKM